MSVDSPAVDAAQALVRDGPRPVSAQVGGSAPCDALLVPTSGLPALVPADELDPRARPLLDLRPGASALIVWDAADGMALEVVVRELDGRHRPVVESVGARRHDRRAAVRAPVGLKVGVVWLEGDEVVHARYETRELSVGGCSLRRRSSGARPLPAVGTHVALAVGLPDQRLVRVVAEVQEHHGEGREAFTRVRFRQLRAADEGTLGQLVLGARAARDRGAR